ncbi:MAG: sensor domain-containing diguanylate cyclase, partial [Lachnospiraceae bacterium]|nr:sensor domain-containing diguanylate cyclase [Lachnospiraceae bacterium]
IAALVVIFGILFYHINGRAKIIKILDNYGVIDRQEGAVLFEYIFSPKKRIDISGDFSHVVGKTFFPLVGEAVYDVYEYVHEDDSSIRGRLHEFFDSEDEVFSSEVRILDQNGDYGWYRLTGTMFRDSDGNCERFVGKVVNANKQISMEKNLVQRAENDLLTGVLNKKTIEAKIAEQLKDKHEGRNYIFFMVDLDNFKNVNDTLGHIYGDKAIADTAGALTEIFHSNAFIGRLGGDEFAVCAIYDAFDEESLMEFIIKNAEKVCEANRREYSDGANTVRISSSVGISIGPKDGRDFELLYKKADEALYNSKKTGKNKFTVYGTGNNKD